MKKLMFLFVFCALGLSAALAQKTFSGKVIGPDGLGLPGVNVVEKANTINGVSTDIDGNWTLTIPDGSSVLEFSSIGMKPIEIAAKDAANITMREDSQVLGEVVVTAMGMSRDKKAIGYAATSVGGDEIQKTQTVNPMNALQGKVAGVDISSAPGPGATQNVLIRGVSSFGNNQPLYIVDGVPITNSQNRSGDNLNSQVDFGSGINALNPDDIENMTILKGAAATALYGSRAANGVIMITTKSGKDTEGKIRVSYDGAMTFSQVGRLPDVQEQFGQGWSGDRALDENGNWGAAYDGKYRVWGNVITTTDENGNTTISQLAKPYNFLDNRVRDFYETGVNYKNAISLNGGNANTNFFLSLSQNSVDGVFPGKNDTYKRYTVATKGMHKAGKLTVSGNVNISTERTKAVPSGQGNSTFRSLYEIANDISITDLEDYHNKYNNPDNYFTPYGSNPWFVLNENGATQKKTKVFGKFQLDYDVIEDLKLTYRFGADVENSTADAHDAVVAFTPGSWNDKRGSSAKNAGGYTQTRRDRIQMNHDFLVAYKKDLSEAITMNAIAGFNANERKYTWLEGAISSIDIPGFYNLSNSLSPSISNQHEMKRRLVGVFANVDFSYRNYAFLTLTARNDWSSTLPEGANSYFYPGATASFLLSEYLKQTDSEIPALSFAKVRLAYGMTGNDATPYYIYDRYVTGTSSNPGFPKVEDLKFPLGGVNSYSMSNQLGNKELEAELTKEFEVGLEARFFDNRVGLDFSYYNRLTEGLIESLPKDPSSGYTYQLANLGDVRNKGIELAINVFPVKNDNFTWNIAWNYSLNRNKVEKLDVDEVFLGGFGGGAIYAVEGQPMGQFKMSTVQTTMIDGVKSIIVDGSGNPVPSATSEYVGKDINEKYRMGLTNTFTYKGLTLSATLDYRYGGYMYTYSKDYLNWTGANPESVMNNRRTFLIPNSVVADGNGGYVENTVPVDPTALHTFYSNGGVNGEQENVIDKSYLKLRNVGLSYNFNNNICEKLHVNNIRLSFTASNILLWTPNENVYIDPETTSFGNDVSAKFGEYGAGPTNQTYTVGLSVGF